MIIVQAPRCKPIPEMNWWNEGPLYQIPDADAFADGLKGRPLFTKMCFSFTPFVVDVILMSSFYSKEGLKIFLRGWFLCGNPL